ncbi:MAG TPA: ABC transporter substrate-binding protein, partial [Acidimicrobiales bacterium]|nr:ABC transporter substrate-binding protein [Acidimicrobiales bacterium]
MHKSKKVFVAVLAFLGLVAAACSSSSSGSGGGGNTVTIGVLTDLTGPAASSAKTTPTGVKAGVLYAKDHGFTVKYIVRDSQTSPTAILAAAHELVQQDHVLAVLAVSSLTFLASSYLAQQHVPVVGVAEDGPEWVTTPTMFSAYGPVDASKVATTGGEFFKMQGATKIGTLGYNISPQSADSAEATAASAQYAGLQAPYVNASFQFGSTNVEPIALAMKAAGVDGMSASVDPNTGLLLVTALRQVGADIKVALLPTGYGGDLEQAGPGALASAQNVYFISTFQPVEMHTSATQQFQKYLKDVGVDGDPTYAEYAGYTSIALLVDGLQAAGSNPTQAKLVTALSGIHNFDAAGLLGSHTIDFADRTASPTGPGNCEYMTKL